MSNELKTILLSFVAFGLGGAWWFSGFIAQRMNMHDSSSLVRVPRVVGRFFGNTGSQSVLRVRYIAQQIWGLSLVIGWLALLITQELDVANRLFFVLFLSTMLLAGITYLFVHLLGRRA